MADFKISNTHKTPAGRCQPGFYLCFQIQAYAVARHFKILRVQYPYRRRGIQVEERSGREVHIAAIVHYREDYRYPAGVAARVGCRVGEDLLLAARAHSGDRSRSAGDLHGAVAVVGGRHPCRAARRIVAAQVATHG